MIHVNLEKIIYVKVKYHPGVYLVSLFIFYPQGRAMGLLAYRYWQIYILMIKPLSCYGRGKSNDK